MKTEIKRWILFVLLAFGISWGFILLFDFLFRGYRESADYSQRIALGSMIASMAPGIASLLVRLITKEGFQNIGLRIQGRDVAKLPNGRRTTVICYTLALIVPVLVAIGEMVLYWIYDRDAVGTDVSLLAASSYLFSSLASTFAVILFATLGEELGWRGYLFVKLEQTVGVGWGVVLTGVIWGIWHLIRYTGGGLSAGTIAGLVLSDVVVLTCYGAFFILVTKKTGSVYPAAIAHAAMNCCNATAQSVFTPEAVKEISEASVLSADFLIYNIPVFLLGIISCIMVVSKKKGC